MVYKCPKCLQTGSLVLKKTTKKHPHTIKILFFLHLQDWQKYKILKIPSIVQGIEHWFSTPSAYKITEEAFLKIVHQNNQSNLEKNEQRSRHHIS